MGGYVVALNTATGSLIWRFATNNQIQSSPTVANGIVYVGSYSGYIYALNATNGALIWSYRAGGPTYSSPAIVNGVLYVGANDGNVYALNANNGGLIWIFYAGNIVYSSPAVVNNVVYVCSEDSSIYALGQLTAQRFGRHTSATERPHRRFSRSGQRHSLHRLLRRLRLCFRHFIGTVNDVSSFSIANPNN